MPSIKASEALKAYIEAADASGAAVLLLADQKIVYLNAEATALTGYTLEAVADQPIDTVIDCPPVGTRRLMRDFYRADGVYRHVECTVALLGSSLTMLTLVDRTAESKSTHELARLRHHLDLILDTLPLIFFSLDPQGNFLMSEGNGLKAVGVQPGQLVGYNAFEVYANEPNIVDLVRRILAGKVDRTYVTLQNRLFDAWMFPSYDDSGVIQSAVGIAIDVTDTESLTRALSSSEANYQRLIANISEAVYTVDRKGRVIMVNDYTGKLIGHPPESLKDKPALHFVAEEDRQRIIDVTGHVYRTGETARIEYRLKHRDDTLIDVESIIHRQDDGSLHVMTHSKLDIERAKQNQMEHEAVLRELALQESLNSMRRSLLGLISHEMRNPLSVVIASSELLERYHDRLTPEKRHTYMTRIRGQVDYLQEMLRDITFVLGGQRRTPEDVTPFNVRDVILRVINQIESAIGSEHDIHFESPEHEFPFTGVENYVRRIVFNLLAHAIKHSNIQSVVTLRLIDDADTYTIEVQDTSSGVPSDDLEILQRPWQPDKQPPITTSFGMGLVIMREYVRLLNGQFSAQNKPEGVLLKVTLPKTTQA